MLAAACSNIVLKVAICVTQLSSQLHMCLVVGWMSCVNCIRQLAQIGPSQLHKRISSTCERSSASRAARLGDREG
ncbi:hypothetical protein F5B22DRAFT_12990 [Xylaria bambusicola]|uniref:uncharacterized protein n=1 Tax=Xylaria bambusicola TaxID=326684 RepID=UPI002008B196|nr:uncharacterized protein F5B22DRAFT_12990 [Xylaria bambusicola]KAI0527961.1 hypothetical protein F5B22DRAFT_12990 [Xylaria bambusicola]